VTANDAYAVLAATPCLILGMWIPSPAESQTLGTMSGIFIAAGEITALYGTYLVLIQLILIVAQPPGSTRCSAQDRITDAIAGWDSGPYRCWVAHAVLTTVGYSMGLGGSSLVGGVS